MLFQENSLSLDFTNYKVYSGCLLIAEPFMRDSSFKRTVVLLAIHNDQEGSLGFIVNKPIKNLYLGDMITSFANAKEWPVFFGGPVQTSSLFFIHQLGDIIEDSKEVADGIYFGGNPKIVEELVKREEATPQDIKFFLGYSGWGKDQLDEEILRNSWLVTGATKDLVFGECYENKAWQKAVRRTPHFYVAHFPENPEWN